MTENILLRLRKVIEYFAYSMLITMTFIICWQVFTRFVLDYTPPWAQELSVMMLVWISFLGISVGFQDNSHIQIDFFVNKMGRKMRLVTYAFQRILAILFGVFMLVEGAKFAFAMKSSSIAGIQISSLYLYIIVPIAGALTIIYLIAEFFGKWKVIVEEEEL